MVRDEKLFGLIESEKQRQLHGIELIASENFVSEQVMQAMGSVLTNKYAEGYPGARYYGGCEVVDQVEQLAIDRLCELYGAEYANVQPHSGAQANMAVFLTVLKPGDTFMGRWEICKQINAMLDVCGAEPVKLSHHLQTLFHHTTGKLNAKRLIKTSVVSPFIYFQ